MVYFSFEHPYTLFSCTFKGFFFYILRSHISIQGRETDWLLLSSITISTLLSLNYTLTSGRLPVTEDCFSVGDSSDGITAAMPSNVSYYLFIVTNIFCLFYHYTFRIIKILWSSKICKSVAWQSMF